MKLAKRLICGVAALLMVCALTACGDDNAQSDSKKDKEESKQSVTQKENNNSQQSETPKDNNNSQQSEAQKDNDNAQELRDGLVEYSFKGLKAYLSEDYIIDNEYHGEDWASLEFVNDNGEDIYVEYGTIEHYKEFEEEYYDGDVKSSMDMANAGYKKFKDDDGSTNEKIGEKHGVPYVWSERTDEAAGEAVVYGCYVDGDSAWLIIVEIIDVEGFSEEKIETLIDYATLGVIE